ncbi:MAG: Mth938-like domain-containing protein [Nitrosomonadales bacterium]|nr:Mth938-like domain-containing protein [Nitrosomonadales bacterium]
MKLHLSSNAGQKMFTAHGAGYVMVNSERYDRSIVVTPGQVLKDWSPQNFDALDETCFEYFLALKPEILLLGTGARQRFPHPRLYQALTAARIGVECMDTPATCRTYNILMAEGRKVVAGILLQG